MKAIQFAQLILSLPTDDQNKELAVFDFVKLKSYPVDGVSEENNTLHVESSSCGDNE